ncbi:prepilin-type N-terminal cleavage/methylation domain-containing protein [Candidatus Albibeggiatoa sp. nov. BB20]|uniref:type II secretion system protein n=1 Tax=Candidatus Albibeggiatoa sp. nov. BB20 TaxID=3162723 RepID=UPI0033655E7A
MTSKSTEQNYKRLIRNLRKGEHSKLLIGDPQVSRDYPKLRQSVRIKNKGFTLLEVTIAILALSFMLLGVVKTIKVQSEHRQYREAKRAAWKLREELIGYAILNNRFPEKLSEFTPNLYGLEYEVDPTALVKIFSDILIFEADPTLCVEQYSEDCSDPDKENIYPLFILTHPDYPDIQEWVTMSYLAGYAVKGWTY